MAVEGDSPEVTSTPPPTLLTGFAYNHGKQSLSERKKNDICYWCHKQGHWAGDCPSSTPAKTNDTCFKCNKQGHWAQDCPSNTPTKPSTLEDMHNIPLLRCHCGAVCNIRVSRSEANPGRKYCTRKCNCDSFKGTKGKIFFQWCDNVKSLMCKCGAGACTINIQRNEKGKDTLYYTCRIQKGHGSCGFKQYDSSESSATSITLPSSMEKDKQASLSSSKPVEQQNFMNLASECRIPNSSDNNIVVLEECRSSLVLEKGCRASCKIIHPDTQFCQNEFLNHMSDAGNLLTNCKALQNLGLHSYGWVGRLAFLPSRILMDPPLKHFFCCIDPLFDPVLVNGHVDVSDSGSSNISPHASLDAKVDEVSQNAITSDTQLLDVPLGTTSFKRSILAVQEHATRTNPFLKEIGRKIQNELLTLLETMEPSDYDTMLQAANATFNALASLSIECGPFAETVMKYIQCKSRGKQPESTIQENCNQQVPTIQEVVENHLSDMSSIHAEALTALTTASSNYLQSAHKEARHLKDMLGRIEKQLHNYVTETSKLETFLLNVAKDVGQSKRSMQTAYKELRKALKLHSRKKKSNGIKGGYRSP